MHPQLLKQTVPAQIVEITRPQNPDRHLRINRRKAEAKIVRTPELSTDLKFVQQTIQPSKKMFVRDQKIYIDPVEQPRISLLLMNHRVSTLALSTLLFCFNIGLQYA